jgi:hypothetical protein
MVKSQNTIVEDRVRERAYALWEMDGRPDGRSEVAPILAFWIFRSYAIDST